MANYSDLITAINAVIKTNGNNEITGTVLQNVLDSIVSTIGANRTFAGIATTATTPRTPDQNVFYIAAAPGIYTNFGGLTVNPNEVALFTNNTSGVWVKDTVPIANFRSLQQASGIGLTLFTDSTLDMITIDYPNRKLIKKAGAFFIVANGNSFLSFSEYGIGKPATTAYETNFIVPTSFAESNVYYLAYKRSDQKLYVIHYSMLATTTNVELFNNAPDYVILGNYEWNGSLFTTNICAPLVYRGVQYINGVPLNRYYNRTLFGYSFYNLAPDVCPFNINYSTQKVEVDAGRMFIFDNNQNTYRDITFDAHTTDFIKPTSIASTQMWYLCFDLTEKKFYLVQYSLLSTFSAEHGNMNGFVILGQGQLNDPNNTYIAGGIFKYNGQIYSPNHSTPTKDKADFIFKERTANLVDPTTRETNCYYSTLANFLSGTLTTGSFGVTKPIPVVVGQRYKRVNVPSSYWWYIYDLDGNPLDILGGGGGSGTNPGNAYTIPEGVGFIASVISPGDAGALTMITLNDVDTSQYIPYWRYMLDPEIKVEATTDSSGGIATFGGSDVGNLQYDEIGTADYAQIIMYGQSLNMGWEAPEAITTTALPGVYMVGDKVAIRHGNNGQNVLNPLVSTLATSCGENPTVAATNAFVTMYRRFMDKQQKFIGTSCGEGGQSVERLSKNCTNTTGSNVENNYYHVEFLNALTRTKSAVDAAGGTVHCPIILYMQGEHNYTGTGLGMTPGTEATRDKDTYKALLVQLKNDMQADIMEKYGQTEKPLFFIYMTAGAYINRFDMSINMGQIEFAEENDDVFLLNPTYGVPDYNGGHLSTNGYRWYGELIAKSLYNVFVRGFRFYPIMPKKYTVLGNQIRIDFYVPVMPLVFDTWTKEAITNNGFRVRMNDADVTINKTTIEDNAVIVTCASVLTGKIEIAYAGQSRSGSGNLRDSDTWRSLYTYYDDRETSPSKRENYTPLDKPGGTYIYGKPYPMYNWCANFYKLISE